MQCCAEGRSLRGCGGVSIGGRFTDHESEAGGPVFHVERPAAGAWRVRPMGLVLVGIRVDVDHWFHVERAVERRSEGTAWDGLLAELVFHVELPPLPAACSAGEGIVEPCTGVRGCWPPTA